MSKASPVQDPGFKRTLHNLLTAPPMRGVLRLSRCEPCQRDPRGVGIFRAFRDRVTAPIVQVSR